MFERIRQVPRLLRDLRDPDKIVLKTRFLELHFERKKQQTKWSERLTNNIAECLRIDREKFLKQEQALVDYWKTISDLKFTKSFFVRRRYSSESAMFMLGDLEIRILKMLTEKPLSTIWLYETLTKQGIQKLAFENAVKSLEKKKLICTDNLRLRLNENGRKMLTILESPQV